MGAKAPDRKAVLVARRGHGRPAGRDATAPTGDYDGHRPPLHSYTSGEIRVNRTVAPTQYQTRAGRRQEPGSPQRGGERTPIGLCRRLAEVGEHTGAYDLRVGADVPKQFNGHVAARVEQAKQ